MRHNRPSSMSLIVHSSSRRVTQQPFYLSCRGDLSCEILPIVKHDNKGMDTNLVWEGVWQGVL